MSDKFPSPNVIRYALPHDLIVDLRRLAKRHNVQPDQLVHIRVKELMAAPAAAFEPDVDAVLKMNTRLYMQFAEGVI